MNQIALTLTLSRERERGDSSRGHDLDIAAAHAWYRKSAVAGDFRGQRSLASVLLEAGFTDEADYWLRRAAASKRIAYR